MAAVDGEGVANLGQGIAVEEPEVEHRGDPREVVEGGTLVDAVAAPGARPDRGPAFGARTPPAGRFARRSARSGCIASHRVRCAGVAYRSRKSV